MGVLVMQLSLRKHPAGSLSDAGWYARAMLPANLETWFDEINRRDPGPVNQTSAGTFYAAENALVWVADAESALQHAFPAGHAIRSQWRERLEGTKGEEWQIRRRGTIDALRAIFRSATGQLKAGRLASLIDGIRAEDASELLDQAEQLAAAGHYLAGAVIAGGALETTLRHLCQRSNALPNGPGSIAQYQQAMATVRKAGTEIISLGDEKQVIAWGDMRNEAAHKPVDFTRNRTCEEVRLMIAGVRAFVGKYT